MSMATGDPAFNSGHALVISDGALRALFPGRVPAAATLIDLSGLDPDLVTEAQAAALPAAMSTPLPLPCIN
jgi:hypothetical protein